MKKQIRNCSLLLLVAAALGGCAQEEFTTDSAEKSKPITLMASVGSDAPQTRIDFEDKDANGIDLNWSKDDVFTVYHKDGDKVGNFRLKSGEGTKHAAFEAVGDWEAMPKGDYVAVYPAHDFSRYSSIRRVTSGGIESGDNRMAQLSEMVHMEVEFAFDPDNTNTTELAFEHTYAMLTIVLNAPTAGSDGIPAKVSMHNSSNNDFTDIQLTATNWDSPIKTYTMMQPSAGERKLTFVVTTSTGKVYTQTIDTNKAHTAGKRYTATLDGLTEETATVDLASFASNAPTSNVWIISDGGAPIKAQFASLRTQLEGIKDSGRKIEIIFPNLITMPESAFQYDDNIYMKALQSVSAPKATEIKEFAFYYCRYLTSIYFPNVTSIGNNAFAQSGLISCDFPKAETIAASAFYGSYLTSVNLPLVTSIDDEAFCYCTSIKTMYIATNSILQSCGEIFDYYDDLSNITLTTHRINGTITGNKWTVPAPGGGTNVIGPFKKIIQFK